MKQSNGKLVFEINESLTFTRDKQILEMISISLDPDIVVQSYEKYVHIHGVILLQGEYVKEQATGANAEFNERVQDKNVRYIENIRDKAHDNSVATFSHRFPVDITVPPYRVKRLDDISIDIDAFDYDLPESSKLNVYATLHIYGIASERMEQDEVNEAKLSEKNRAQAKTEGVTQQDNHDVPLDENEKKLYKTDGNARPKQKEEQLNVVKDEKNTVISEEEKVQEAHGHLQQPENGNVQTSREDEAIEIQLNENMEESQEQEIKDVTFLTELFSEAEEKFSEMKIYIAQDDDTVESIAKRYKVSVLQLMKDNQLLEHSIQGGQLIKIYRHKSHQA